MSIAAAMNNGLQGHNNFIRFAFDKPMFIPSFEQAEQLALAKEEMSSAIVNEMKDDKELFFQFMDSFCEDEKQFHRFAELFKELLIDDKDYLDKAMELRNFSRSCLFRFAENEAHARLIKGR